MTLVLQQGDYVSIKGVSDEQYKALGSFFISFGAGKGEFPNITWQKHFSWLGWRWDGLYHSGLPKENFKGRQLTVAEVLASAKATEWKPKVGEECEKSFTNAFWEKIIPKYIGESHMLYETSSNKKEGAVYMPHFKFRQIKSEKEIAIEQLADLIGPAISILTPKLLAEIVYDAGWRKP